MPNFTVVAKIRTIFNVRPGNDLHIYNDVLAGVIELSWEPHNPNINPIIDYDELND